MQRTIEKDIEENVVDISALKPVPLSVKSSKGEVDTATTVSDSLDSSAFSSFCSGNAMSFHINDTRCVGSVSSSISSVCFDAVNNDEMREADDRNPPVEESMKERNRRLLIHHRESKARAQKHKEINDHKELPTIKEDDLSDEGSDLRGDVVVDPLTLTVSDVLTEDDRRCEVQLFLERKFRSSCGVKKDVRKRRREPGNSAPTNVLRFGCWSEGVLSVACVVLLYSSPVARYAMFRSLRRFKLGD